jgi:hypothetical protein
MKRVTKQRSKRRRCKACKEPVPVGATGRRSIYCCAACRQRDYRKRVAARPPVPMQLLAADLFAIRDREARKRGAIAVLEGLGYAVHLERAAQPPRATRPPRPALKIVRETGPAENARPDAPD